MRLEKFECIELGLETQRSFFSMKFAENESVSRISYKIVQKITEQGKSFIDVNFIDEHIMGAANEPCLQKAFLFESISLSANLVVQRTAELGENLVLQISLEFIVIYYGA